MIWIPLSGRHGRRGVADMHHFSLQSYFITTTVAMDKNADCVLWQIDRHENTYLKYHHIERTKQQRRCQFFFVRGKRINNEHNLLL